MVVNAGAFPGPTALGVVRPTPLWCTERQAGDGEPIVFGQADNCRLLPRSPAYENEGGSACWHSWTVVGMPSDPACGAFLDSAAVVALVGVAHLLGRTIARSTMLGDFARSPQAAATN